MPFRLAVESERRLAHDHDQDDFKAGGHKAYDPRHDGWVTPPICSGAVAASRRCVRRCRRRTTPRSRPTASRSTGCRSTMRRPIGRHAAADHLGRDDRLDHRADLGPTGGDSTAQFSVRFTSTGSAVLLAWGGHLAQSRYWNMANGGPVTGPGRSPGHRGTCGPSTSTAQAPGTRTAASSRARSSASCRPSRSRRRPHRPLDQRGGVAQPRWRNGALLIRRSPTAPATSTCASPVSTAPGIRWEIVALLGFLATAGRHHAGCECAPATGRSPPFLREIWPHRQAGQRDHVRADDRPPWRRERSA